MRRITLFAVLIIVLTAGACEQGSGSSADAGEAVPVKAAVLFVAGQVTTGSGEPVKTGTIITDGTVIKTGGQSICDLQIAAGASRLTVRVKANSEFDFNARRFADGSTRYDSNLRSGSSMYQLDNREANSAYRMTGPTAVAAVRGTKFEMSVEADGSTRTAVYEGQVHYRPRVEQVENLPDEVVSESKVLNDMVTGLEENGTELKAGQAATMTRQDVDQRLEANPEVKDALNDPAVAALQNKRDATPEEVRQAVEKIDQAVPEEKRETIRQNIQQTAPPETESVPDQEMQQREKEYESLVGIDVNDTMTAEEAAAKVQERNQAQRAQLQRTIESVFNKKSETLILKSGQRIQGVIYQQGENYVVYTVDGKVFIQGSQVDGFAF
ncbi:MAG: FecR domain-containing protein [Leptospiraceae bacterium]|nr:FecR domain-containing protein [Leptospiraceae bacterium]MCB1320674.1 FecR domain-containing protein [Leptospiraceae bacterium]